MKTLLLHAILASACLLAEGAFSQDDTFTTIAGSVGLKGSTDGTNFQAMFNFPVGLAVDREGVLYLTDLLNHTIRQVKQEGTNWITTTLAGLAPVFGYADGTNSDARFDHPTGIAVAPDGSLFVSDKYNNCIRKLTRYGTNWVVTTIAGQAGVQASDDGTNSGAHFWGPAGLVVTSSNQLFVADASNHMIRKVVPEGTNWIVTTLAGVPPPFNFDLVDGTNQDARFNYPYAIARNTSGTLFIADFGNNAIRQLEPIGTNWVTTTIAGNSAALGSNDGPGFQATFRNPSGITIGKEASVFVTDYNNHTVRLLASAGTNWDVSTFAGRAGLMGTNDGVGTAALFNHPRDVTVDPTGALLVSDYSNQTIRMGVGAPFLQMLLSGGLAVLAWPLWANNYALETSSNLAPSPLWTVLTNIAVVGNTFVFTNDVEGSAFFRLNKQ